MEDYLEYQAGRPIEAKVSFSPPQAVAGGFIRVIKYPNIELPSRIELTPDNIEAWIELPHNFDFEVGDIQAVLVRTVGNGKWSATVQVRTEYNDGTGDEAKVTRTRTTETIHPSVRVRRA